jgi:hypothetical protein
MKVAELLDSLLQGDRLVNIEHVLMSGMPCPQELNVSGLRLDSVAESTFSRLKKLRVLDLRGNNLKQLHHSALAGPTSLREVYLSGKQQLASPPLIPIPSQLKPVQALILNTTNCVNQSQVSGAESRSAGQDTLTFYNGGIQLILFPYPQM